MVLKKIDERLSDGNLKDSFLTRCEKKNRRSYKTSCHNQMLVKKDPTPSIGGVSSRCDEGGPKYALTWWTLLLGLGSSISTQAEPTHVEPNLNYNW